MDPVTIALLALAGLDVGSRVYDYATSGREKKAEARTATSAGIAAMMDQYLLEQPERESRAISRTMAVQETNQEMTDYLQLAFTDPLAKRTGMAQAEVDRIAALAYNPGPSPAEIMTYFGGGRA